MGIVCMMCVYDVLYLKWCLWVVVICCCFLMMLFVILNSFDELIFVIVMFFFIMLYCIEILYLWEEGMVVDVGLLKLFDVINDIIEK